MTQCPICGQEIQESATRCETCERWAAGVVAAIPEAPPATAPAAPAAKSRPLLWIPVVIIASGAITLAALMSRADAPDVAAAAANPRAANGASAAAKPVRATRQKWTAEHRERWMAEGRASAAFELPAEDMVQIWTRRVRPSLVVRCVSGKIETFVFTDTALAIEPNTPDHTVTFRLDTRKPRTERWPDSVDHDALFAPNGAAFAEALAASSILWIGYTPHNAAPVTAEFTVGGLEYLMASAGKACAPARPTRP